MPTDKEMAAKQLKGTGLASQQALVKRLLRRTVQPVKMVIPGGKELFEVVDRTNIADTVFTWLRRVNQFSDVRISLASNPDQMKLVKRKVEDLENFKDGPVWWRRDFGKKKLAELLGNVLFEHELVMIEATKEGIWIYQDPTKEFSEKSDTFEPYVEFTPTTKKNEEYRE